MLWGLLPDFRLRTAGWLLPPWGAAGWFVIIITQRMQKISIFLVAMVACTPRPSSPANQATPGAELEARFTYPDQSLLFAKVPPQRFVAGEPTGAVIAIDTAIRYQTMDGFGYTLTGGSAMHIHRLEPAARTALLKELFLPDGEGIGISYLRISIGASDLDDRVFSYNDVPAGTTDMALARFSIDPDRRFLIPVLKEILALRPDLKIMGSPWSAPAWMKTNGAVKGGSLKPSCYPVYARYFVKYIQAMAAEGIAIDAITIQNEPENPNNTPSMVMTAAQQNDFIKNHLGPAFRGSGLATKIILFDHNCDNPDYPISILNDPVTKSFVDGSAFHLYLGDIRALRTVHEAHPDRHLYFTEQWTSGRGNFADDLRWHLKNLIVGAPQNWSRTVLEWNLAADENLQPHTDEGGCTLCLGALTIHTATGVVTRNVAYYIIAHASKYVPPGSVRVHSTPAEGLHPVAFVTPQGRKVVVVVNDDAAHRHFSVLHNGSFVSLALPSGGVGTYVW